jgi:hypothetical protein
MIPVFHYGVVTLAERLGLKTIPPKVEFEIETGAPAASA